MAKVNLSLPKSSMTLEETNKFLFDTVQKLTFILGNIDESNLNKYYKERVKNGTVK